MWGIPDATNFTYDRTDRIKTANGDIDEAYTVDANGNMTKRGYVSNEIFNYDQENRMINAESNKYFYDGDGNRTKITKDNATINTYLYDINTELPILLQDKNRKYVWGLDLLYTVDSANNPGIYHFDGLGSMRAITDVRTPDSPRIQMYEDYRAFGVEGYSNRLYDQPFKFTGEQKDELIHHDLIYLRSRYYDPKIGRFMTRDSYAGDTTQPLSLNRYSYTRNNPVNLVDPSGMVDAYQVGLGIMQVAGGSAEIGIGISVGLATTAQTIGASAVVTTSFVTHGLWNLSAGSAQIMAGINDKEINPPNPLRAVTSGFTSDEGYLSAADLADFTIFSKISSLNQANNSSIWLIYADRLGYIENFTELTVGKYIKPLPVYSKKKNK
jgi:RHS repeat-associated protein